MTVPELAPPSTTARPEAVEPVGGVAAFVELLQRPEQALARMLGPSSTSTIVSLLVGTLLCLAAYGAAAGFFQGDVQIAVSGMKAPLIVGMSVLLCAPSLFVFASLTGARLSGRRFIGLLAGFCGMLAMLFIGLLPITWLFSVSTHSLHFLTWLHLLVWLVALFFGLRYLARGLEDARTRSVLAVWALVLFFVGLQVATYLRPVLWRAEGAPLFESGKKLFTAHLGSVIDYDEAVRAAASKVAEEQAAERK